MQETLEDGYLLEEGLPGTARAHSCAAWVVWRDGYRLVILDSVGSIG
jgi:hypothetical protein